MSTSSAPVAHTVLPEPRPAPPKRRTRIWVFAALALVLVGAGVGLAWWRPWQRVGAPATDSPEYQLQQARLALSNRDFEQARERLRHCLEACPFGAEIHFLMAQACRRMDDLTAWEDYLFRARILQWPENELVFEMQLKEAQAGDIWRVERTLLEQLDHATPKQEVLIREALCKGYLEGDVPRRAAEVAHQWLERWPNDWEGWLYRGRAYQQGTAFEKAVADYQKVLELRPGQSDAQHWLADTHLALQQFEQAEPAYQAFLREHAATADVLWGLGKCQYQLGQHEAAADTLGKLVKLDPRHVPGLLLRAKLILPQEPEQALTLLKQAVKLRPYETDVLHNIILALRQLHRTAEADKYDRLLNAQKPLIAQLNKLRMQLLHEPDNLDLRCDIGKLYLAQGDEEEAAHWFQEILYMDPYHRPTCLALAEYWDKHGDQAKAAHYRQKAGEATKALTTKAISSGKPVTPAQSQH